MKATLSTFLVCRKLFLVLLIVTVDYFYTSATQISCESVKTRNWGAVGVVKTCELQLTTSIDFEGVTVISPWETSIEALDFFRNRKIAFLPIGVAEAFPTLFYYGAAFCSLTKVRKENFMNLNNLKQLDLRQNQIEVISSDTFDDLKSLEVLDFGMEKILFQIF